MKGTGYKIGSHIILFSLINLRIKSWTKQTQFRSQTIACVRLYKEEREDTRRGLDSRFSPSYLETEPGRSRPPAITLRSDLLQFRARRIFSALVGTLPPQVTLFLYSNYWRKAMPETILWRTFWAWYSLIVSRTYGFFSPSYSTPGNAS